MTENERKLKVAGIIEQKLAYTNGWAVPDGRYVELCREVATEILAALADSEAGQENSEALTQHVRTFVKKYLYFVRDQENLVDQLLVLVLSAPLAQPHPRRRR